MSAAAFQVLEQLQAAFPRRAVAGVITPHDCDECSAMRERLEGKTWDEVPDKFANDFAGCLPLLSPEAYNAYLPIWLRAAVSNPDGEAASMIAINLFKRTEPRRFYQCPSSGSHRSSRICCEQQLLGYRRPNERRISCTCKGRVGQQCCLTLRSTRRPSEKHLAREALVPIILLASQALCRCPRVTSNVRPHEHHSLEVRVAACRRARKQVHGEAVLTPQSFC